MKHRKIRSTDDMAKVILDFLRSVCGKLNKDEIRFYERELVTIGTERVVAKKDKYILDGGKQHSFRRIVAGQEYERPVQAWRTYPSEMLSKGHATINSGTLSLKATENEYFIWDVGRRKSQEVHFSFWSLTYRHTDLMRRGLVDFLDSVSKSRRKLLDSAITKFSAALGDIENWYGTQGPLDPSRAFTKAEHDFYKRLRTIFEVTFPYPYSSQPYGIEMVPTKEEERDRLIADLLNSKRIIDEDHRKD